MKKTVISLMGLLFIGALSVSALLNPGFFDFHDDTQVARVYEMANSLKDGQFPVRWVEHLGYGYGYPLFNFYAPFAYYFGSFWILLGLDALIATKIMFVFGILLSSAAMFFFTKKFFGNLGGIVSAVVYLYFPYHAVNIYVRGAVSEFYAYAFLPLVFYGIYNLIVKKEKTNFRNYFFDFLLISLGVFFIAISHNLSFLMLMLILFPTFIIGFMFTRNKLNFILIFSFSIIFGIALASFYIIPALFEMGFTNVRSQIGGGADFRDHFVCLPQLWDSAWGFGGSIAGCMDGMSFKMGKLNFLILLMSVLIFIYSLFRKQFKDLDKLFIGSFILLAISIFLITDLARIIWEIAKPMEYIQYPWRFLNYIGLFLSFIFGYLIFKLTKLRKEISIIIAIVIIAGTVATNYGLFQPQNFMTVGAAYFTNIDALTKVASKVSDEYLPVGSKFPLQSGFDIDVIGAVNPKIKLLDKKTGYYKFGYKNDSESVILMNYISYFPSWNAYFNGDKIQVFKSIKNTPEFELNPGEGILEMKFEQTGVQKTGNTISTLAFLGLFIGIIYNIKHKSNKNG